MDKLVTRAKAILLSPATEWPVIANEPATVREIFKTYVVWLAAITAVADFVGSTIVGYRVPILGTYRIGFGAGFTGAVITYVLSLAGVLLAAYLTDVLALRFGGEKNFTRAVKTVAYAYTPSWIAGVGLVVPGIRWLIALAGGAYTIYLIYLGLPYTMKCPPEKTRCYAAMTLVASVSVRVLVGVLAVPLGGVGFSPYGAWAASIPGGFDPASPGGKLEQWSQGLQAGTLKMQAAERRGDSLATAHSASRLVGAALAGDATAEPLDPERIRAFLPSTVGRLMRVQISAERRCTPLGNELSEAQAQYNDGRGHLIDLKIGDGGGASGLVWLASWLAGEEDKRTPAGHEKTYKSGDRMVSERWNPPAGPNAMGYGEYAVTVGQRYVVQASGQVADIETLRSVVGSVDLAKLESPKTEGFHQQ